MYQTNKNEALTVKRHWQKECKSNAERMRRNRINGFLEELKLAILGSSFQNIKMEQAEVLELTVEYVKLIKQQKFTLNYKEHVEPLYKTIRYHTPCDESQLNEKKRKLHLRTGRLSHRNDVMVKTHRRKMKGKRLEFSRESYANPSLQKTSIDNSAMIIRQPLSNLSNITNDVKDTKKKGSCPTFWRPWQSDLD